mgnify:CR=1 FL=1
MTNEEAIEILQEEHDWVQEPCYVMNAIEKAIEALRSASAHIDREAWGTCDSCVSCSNCDNAMQDSDDYPCCECIDQTNQCGLLQASMKYFHATGYCRHCGRPLTEAAWAKLEAQLRAAMAATKGEQHGKQESAAAALPGDGPDHGQSGAPGGHGRLRGRGPDGGQADQGEDALPPLAQRRVDAEML